MTSLLDSQQIKANEKSDRRHEYGSHISTEKNAVADAVFVCRHWRNRPKIVADFFSTARTGSSFATRFGLEVMPAMLAVDRDNHFMKPDNHSKTELLSNAG